MNDDAGGLPPADEWTAYCAPGRKPVVEMLAVLRPEKVTEVFEHPWLAGRTDYLLVKAGAFDCLGALPVEPAAPLLPRCPWCGGAGRHYTWCYSVSSVQMPSAISVTS